MEHTPWKLPVGPYTMEVISRNLRHGRYPVEFTPWKVPHGSNALEVS